VPDDVRATETAFVHLCLQIWATVDTTDKQDAARRRALLGFLNQTKRETTPTSSIAAVHPVGPAPTIKTSIVGRSMGESS
jgi:hypothetical protein